ncbi:MAG: hypothetical protein ISR26_10315 [Porticoccaceae bacterium]|nr:hypothetical protein [Porticoccaceae bacterium]
MLLKNPRLKFFFCFFVLVISSSSFSVDTDLDGLSDVWELANNRDPLVSDYQIEVSYDHTCAKHDNGVTCWGEDVYGETSAPPVSNPKSWIRNYL